MRHVVSATLALLLTTALAQAEATPGGTADLIVQPEPPGLMIGIVTNGPALAVGGNIYESLLRYDETLAPMPSLARSWEVSEDGLTYTFHLQEGVTFHDGTPMTAADVLFSVNDFLMKTQPRHRNTMAQVESVTAPDEATVVFKLTQPFEPFIRAFAYGTMPILPKHIYEGTDYMTNPANDKPIGTGPFRFVEWQRGSFIKLEKNDAYWDKGKPYLDEVIYHVIPDAASRAVAYETGVVDILPGGSVENFDIPRLTELPNTCITDKGWEYYAPLSWMWLNNRNPPMDNPKFRQAVMYAMDRQFALDVLWNGYGKVATGPISSKTPFYSQQEPVYEYDPDKAEALLDEIGYDGEPIRLLPIPYGETWQRWAEAVRQNLQDVGIKVEMEAADVAGWNQRTANWNYDIAFTYLYQNGDPAIGVSRNYITSQIEQGSPWNNVEGYSDPEVDRMFEEAALAYPAEARQEIYDQVQVKLQEDVPVAWLLELTFPTIYNCKVHDIVTSAHGPADSMRDAWIEQ
ncbi:ABC transporter substrate-binding protein [Falsirhodobacter deserti]|uniref:ABC transporter substrate-binding protein n=1 Tax=Falsirhodobacter deserti TaxID=1365611 RepID=UPI000FE35AD5|nr:ABC transporter substrate-binding protein [Falsirhodobacter deserti]